MGIDWDKHLLSILHTVFAEKAHWRPKSGDHYDIEGIFDRSYAQNYVCLDGEGGISTTRPILGVRDALFLHPPEKGDKVFIYSANTVFIVSEVQPDSHGGSHLILNKVTT